MSQVMKKILSKRTVGTYGSNELGALMRELDTRFEANDFQAVKREAFEAKNPNVKFKAYIVACAVRGHYIDIRGDVVFIWINEEVCKVVHELKA